MSDDSDSDGGYYGPALPPHLKNTVSDEGAEVVEDNNKRSRPVVGPLLVADNNLQAKSSISQTIPAIGPTLPPGFKLPPIDDDEETDNVQQPISDDNQNSYDDDDDDEEVIGPLPPDHPLQLARSAAFAASSRPTGDDKPKKKLQREEWMLIPPSNKPVTELGLGPRKFLQRAPEKPVKDNGEPMDSDEELERETRAAMDQKLIDDYDKKMEAMIEKTGEKKRKSESLLQQHQRELKKKSKKEKSEEAKRKPFDRNTDLAVGGLSREDSKKYIERTKELSGRFSKGRQKFL